MRTLNINYGTNFLSLDLFNSSDFEHIDSIICRVPLSLTFKDQKILLIEFLKQLEESSHEEILDNRSTDIIKFSSNIDKVILTGVKIPEVITLLDVDENMDPTEILLGDKRLIVNWGFNRIDFIFGKNHVITYSLTYENLIKEKHMQKFLENLKITKGNFKNFETAFPLMIGENSYLENIFFGLVMESVTRQLQLENPMWDKDLHEIILTGEYISTRPDSYQLLEMVGSAIGLIGIFEFYVDRYNFFNSTEVSAFRETAEIFNYLFVPKTLRGYNHAFVSDGARRRQTLILDDNKIRLVDTSTVDILEVSVEKHNLKKDVEIKGNYTYVDTRDFNYSDFVDLMKNSQKLGKIFHEWERGINEDVEYTKSSIFNINLPRFIYTPAAEFKKQTDGELNLVVRIGDSVVPKTVLGVYPSKSEVVALDLVSALNVFEDFYKHIDVIDGQNVVEGTVLASRKSMLGNMSHMLKAPFAGTVRLGKMEYGFIEIEYEMTNVQELSDVKGKVRKIYPNKGIELSAPALRIKPVDIAGRSMSGGLVVDFLNKDLKDKVVFLGRNDFDIISVRKLIQIGVKGILFDTIKMDKWATLKDFIQNSGINMGIGVVDGFDLFPSDDGLLRIIESLEGRLVSFDIDNELINFFIEGEEKFSMNNSHKAYVKSFHSRENVYLRDLSHWGQKAKILNIQRNNANVKINGQIETVSLFSLE